MLAENGIAGDAFEIGRQIKEKFPNYDTRISVLGHIQTRWQANLYGPRIGQSCWCSCSRGLKSRPP